MKSKVILIEADAFHVDTIACISIIDETKLNVTLAIPSNNEYEYYFDTKVKARVAQQIAIKEWMMNLC